MKRYNCTVGDKRGEFGDCMELAKDGRYITYIAHKRFVDDLQRQLKMAKDKLRRIGSQ